MEILDSGAHAFLEKANFPHIFMEIRFIGERQVFF